MSNPLCVCMNVMCSQLGRCLKESMSVTPTTNSNTILPELEQLKREYFEAGRKLTDRSAPTMDGFFIGGSQVKYTTFEDYEAQRLLSKKEIEK